MLMCVMAADSWPAVTSSQIQWPNNNVVGTAYTYDQQPWVLFSAATTGDYINGVAVGVWNPSNSSWLNMDSNTSLWGWNVVPASFNPMPVGGVASGTLIHHRMQFQLAYNTVYILYVWAQAATAGSNFIQSPGVQIEVIQTPWALGDDNSLGGGTRIRALHFTDLRGVINNIRNARGYNNFSYTYPAPTVGALIHATEVIQMRTAISGPLSRSCGSASESYSYTPAGGTLIHAADINQLRAFCILP